MESVEERVLDIVAQETRQDRADVDPNLKISDIESLDLVQIMFAIEDQFDVYIPQDDDSFTLETVRDIVRGVEYLLAQKQSSAAGSA
jgi:acyl carrier protein